MVSHIGIAPYRTKLGSPQELLPYWREFAKSGAGFMPSLFFSAEEADLVPIQQK